MIVGKEHTVRLKSCSNFLIIRFFIDTLPLTAVIITLNAASQIGPCIDSVKFCDEVLVVDAGSTDATVQIAQMQGARVVHQEWLGYGPQKRFAVSLAMHDWVLCIDADEQVSERLRGNIIDELKAPRAQAYEMPRCNRFMGRWLKHGEGYPDWSLRLFNRRFAGWSDDRIHEKVVSNVPALRLQGDLLHDTAETLEGYLTKQNRYTSLQAAQMAEEGIQPSLTKLLLSPMLRFIKFYMVRLGILDGVPGLVHIAIGTFNSFVKQAKLMCLQQRRNK